MGLDARKPVFGGLQTTQAQPAHPRSLISAFVIRLLKSIISRLSSSKISILYLVSVAEQAGLNLTFWETLKTGFLVTRPILKDFLRNHSANLTQISCEDSYEGGGTRNYVNGLGHMTKMEAMPIYGKILYTSFPEPELLLKPKSL